MGERFNLWQIKNANSTREFCNDLLIQLKQTHLDPVLQQLRGKGGAQLSFDDIIGGYNRIKDEYDKSAIGAKDVIAAVFFEFHPVSQRDAQGYIFDLMSLPPVLRHFNLPRLGKSCKVQPDTNSKISRPRYLYSFDKL